MLKTIAQICSLLIFCLCGRVLPAQLLGEDGLGYRKDMKIDHTLYKIGRYYERASRENFQKFAPQVISTLYDGRVKGSVVNTQSRDQIDLKLLESLGLQVVSHAGRRAKCAFEPARIAEFEAALPAGYFIEATLIDPQNNEGPAMMNTEGYKTNGPAGAGIKAGVIDYNFLGLGTLGAVNEPNIPPARLLNLRGDGTLGARVHGAACVEIVYDHVPDATFYVMCIDNDSSDWVNAIQWAIDSSIDVISCSLGPHNTGWDDNTGYACQAALAAANSGALFFVSAGNEAQVHYLSDFIDADNNNQHDFAPGDNGNTVVVSPPGPNANANGLNVWLQWDASPPGDPYDLILSVPGIDPVSANSNQFESVYFANTGNTNVNANILVVANVSNPPPFEIFIQDDNGDLLQYAVAESSLESPANTTHANVISVGAVNQQDYVQGHGADVITNYSSRGPTHGGVLAPDLCAPTNCTTASYNGGFTGTSCAAPNAAGATAAFWAAHPHLNADGVRQILYRKSQIYRDWGATGNDNIYGRGGLFFYTFHDDNRYVYSASGNTTGSSALPYASMQQADQFAPANRRLIFLGETHQEPPPGTVLSKPALYKSAGLEVDTIIK